MCYILVNIAENVVFMVEGDQVRHCAIDHNQTIDWKTPNEYLRITRDCPSQSHIP